MNLEDFRSEKAKLLHTELRVFYDAASQHYPPKMSSGWGEWELEQLLKAIAGARIYFWIRTYDGTTWLEGLGRNELNKLVFSIPEHIKHDRIMYLGSSDTGFGQALSASHAIMLRYLAMKIQDGQTVSDRDVEQLREECMRVFAHLKTRFTGFLN